MVQILILVVMVELCVGYHQNLKNCHHYYFDTQTQASEHSPKYDSREVNQRRQTGSGLNFWQFKKSSRERDSWEAYGRNDEWMKQRYGNFPPKQRNRNKYYIQNESEERKFGKDKKNLAKIPFLSNIFGKKRKPEGRRPPHEQYAPAFISYGPIFGPPPPSLHGQGHNVNNKQPSVSALPLPPNLLSHRISSTTAASFQYGVSQSPARPSPTYGPPLLTWTQSTPPPYGLPTWSQSPATTPQPYGPSFWSQSPQTTPFTFIPPSPTYGPTVRIPLVQPQQNSNSHYSTSNRSPTRYKQPNQWEPVNTQTPQNQPVMEIHQSLSYNPQDQSRPSYQPQQPSPTYLPPSTTSPIGWSTWSTSSPPLLQTSPPQHNPNQQNSYQYEANQQEQPPKAVPMNFGPPMHNFGPPLASYGQPPPIIGDPPHNRYAPKDEMYTYPTQGQGQQQQWTNYKPQQQPQQQQQQQQQQQYNQYRSDDNGDTYTSASESDEVYSTYQKPTTDLYQTPKKSYYPPYQRQHVGNEDRDVSQNYNTPNNYYSTAYNPQLEQSSDDPRPTPQFDTNYNSPGLSKDPKIVDFMPYNGKTYHELPGQKKRRKPRYRTLPESLQNYQPDPEHEKYPKLAYDSLSKQRLPITAAALHRSQETTQSSVTNPNHRLTPPRNFLI